METTLYTFANGVLADMPMFVYMKFTPPCNLQQRAIYMIMRWHMQYHLHVHRYCAKRGKRPLRGLFDYAAPGAMEAVAT